MFVLFEFIEHRINSKIIFISEIFKRCSINQDRIFDLYLGIAAIIGTFLGLYFIAITIISQTVYSKIKGEIRSLLNADKITNLYIEKLIFLLSFVLISIFSMILKYEIGYFNFILTAFLAFITVISFWKLAIRVFNFFNPVYLISIYLLPEINRCLAIVSKNKLFKFDINFQNYSREEIIKKFDIYRDIFIFITKQQPLQTNNLFSIANLTLSILNSYERIKKGIPVNSHWFEREKEYINVSYGEKNLCTLIAIPQD